MAHKVTPFLMFEGSAEEDSVKRADFTPAMSLFVECESEAELDRTFGQLSSAQGAVIMPPDSYGFSKKFTWVNDRYGVSWQLNWQ